MRPGLPRTDLLARGGVGGDVEQMTLEPEVLGRLDLGPALDLTSSAIAPQRSHRKHHQRQEPGAHRAEKQECQSELENGEARTDRVPHAAHDPLGSAFEHGDPVEVVAALQVLDLLQRGDVAHQPVLQDHPRLLHDQEETDETVQPVEHQHQGAGDGGDDRGRDGRRRVPRDESVNGGAHRQCDGDVGDDQPGLDAEDRGGQPSDVPPRDAEHFDPQPQVAGHRTSPSSNRSSNPWLKRSA